MLEHIRFTYETYAQMTYVKIRMYVSKIKYFAYLRIELRLSSLYN